MITIALIVLLVLIGLSIPVGASLGLLGLSLDSLYSFLPLTQAVGLSLIHISEPTRRLRGSRMPSSA